MNRTLDELNAWIEAKRPNGRPRTWRAVLASGLWGLFLGLVLGLCAIESGAL